MCIVCQEKRLPGSFPSVTDPSSQMAMLELSQCSPLVYIPCIDGLYTLQDVAMGTEFA